MISYSSHSLEETLDFAADMAAKAKAGDIICLNGNLGAGKTAFAKGFAKGLGINGYVNSPTFTLMQIYEDGRLPMYHFDLYRLAESLEYGNHIDADTLEDIGFFEYLDAKGICLIEWAEYAGDLIPKNASWIDIEICDDFRKINISEAK